MSTDQGGDYYTRMKNKLKQALPGDGMAQKSGASAIDYNQRQAQAIEAQTGESDSAAAEELLKKKKQ